MLKKSAISLLSVALLVTVGACEADREGAQQMDPSPNPAIEAAPATPTPPVGIPMPGTPEAAEQARQEGDTLRQDTLRRDTLPRRP